MKAWKESISCLVALSSILLLVLLATSSTFIAASSTDESSKSLYSQLSFLRTSIAALRVVGHGNRAVTMECFR